MQSDFIMDEADLRRIDLFMNGVLDAPVVWQGIEHELDLDREYIMTLYPARARIIMVLIEEECDKLEYTGSPMLAPIPDKEEMLKIARGVYEKVSCNDDEESNLRYMIEVLVCNEFVIRRSRYKRRSRFF